jgi:hypothetical protein
MKIFFNTAILLLMTLLTACNSAAEEKQPRVIAPSVEKLSCVEQILLMDDSLGTVRNHACEKISLSESIDNYVQGFESLDYEACPQFFRHAFGQHLDAWKDMMPITNKHPELRGEMHELFDQLKESADSAVFNRKLKKIQDTWTLVEQTK